MKIDALQFRLPFRKGEETQSFAGIVGVSDPQIASLQEFYGTGFPSTSRILIGAIPVALSGASIVARSPTITMFK